MTHKQFLDDILAEYAAFESKLNANERLPSTLKVDMLKVFKKNLLTEASKKKVVFEDEVQVRD